MDDLKENNIRIEDTKMIRLPLTSDYVFKRIFAREENNSMLKDFLEAILNIHINKVEVKNPELTPNMADEKLGILDLKLDIDNERVRAAVWVLFNDILGICLTIYNFIFGELIIGIVLIIFILVITYQSIMILKK